MPASYCPGLQKMLVLADQLPSLEAAGMTSHFPALIENTNLAMIGADQHGFAGQAGRHGVAIGIELDAGVRVDDDRHHFVGGEGHGR